MEASSVLVGNPLTSVVTSDSLGELPSPSEPTEEAGDQCLGSGLCRKVEPEPMSCGEQPSPSVSMNSSGSMARKHLMEPVGVFFLCRVLPVLLPMVTTLR